jgi:2-C-methyl-D-erythritol 2,4-cyclodiphosphate synthase
MIENIAKILGCTTSQINIKATTSEGLGFAGTGKGMAAYASVLIMKA